MNKIYNLFVAMISVALFTSSTNGQNLVPNPSFEDTVSCPNALDQINRAVGWSNYLRSCDYFNSCAPFSSHVSVPANLCGYHYARTGNAYAGLSPYFTLSANTREYMGIQLAQPLDTGTKYFASFYVSRAAAPTIKINIACNKIGMRLSTIAYSGGNEPVGNYAQIYTDSIITDTLNWVKISGSFIADSAYSYLSIGNFFDDSLSSIIEFDSTSTQAYYYIDDICLTTDSNGCLLKDALKELPERNPIYVFPNPAYDWITVEASIICKLSIYNILGKLCLSDEVLHASHETINVSNLDKGIYFLTIQTSNDNITKKIIIK